MKNVDFIRNAEHIELFQRNKTKGDVTLIVNDHEIELNRRHPIAVTASLTTCEDALESLKNGHFVIEHLIDGTGKPYNDLKEWRDQSYTGFMQSDAFIDRFSSDTNLLQRAFDDFSIDEYGAGGKFDISTGFNWSAFKPNLKTQVNILRQICSNGMVARSPLFEREVPIINLFDRHLDIAARQMGQIARREIANRIEVMGREHSTVREVDLVLSHIERRINDEKMYGVTDKRLENLRDSVYVAGNISPYYKQGAIETGIVKALPSPISRFDLWNIVTEMNSHTHGSIDSTSSALDRIASGLVFPKRDGIAITEKQKGESTFGSPEQAFFSN